MTRSSFSTIVKEQKVVAVFTFFFMLAALIFGYMSFGFWASLIFTAGFLGGYILWLSIPTRSSWAYLSPPYFLTLAFFAIHKIEEKHFLFTQALSNLTGGPIPQLTSFPVIMLLVLSIGSWLLAPFLVSRGYAFGYYLMWTFFANMGIAELAHFIFPFFTGKPYGYFPGMASVFLLAPAAWWGLRRLKKNTG